MMLSYFSHLTLVGMYRVFTIILYEVFRKIRPL